MKAYVITASAVFDLQALAHIARVFAKGLHAATNRGSTH
jgi:hypothetical protein